MTTKPLIRRAEVLDARSIHEAHMRSIRETCSAHYTPEEITAWAGREFNETKRIDSIKNDFLWVVENQGTIEGFGHLILESEKDAYIEALYFCLSVIGKGVGHRMLKLMEEVARDKKNNTITLNSTITSLPFYKIQGYREMGPQITVQINGAGIRCHPMEKKLNTLKK